MAAPGVRRGKAALSGKIAMHSVTAAPLGQNGGAQDAALLQGRKIVRDEEVILAMACLPRRELRADFMHDVRDILRHGSAQKTASAGYFGMVGLTMSISKLALTLRGAIA